MYCVSNPRLHWLPFLQYTCITQFHLWGLNDFQSKLLLSVSLVNNNNTFFLYPIVGICFAAHDVMVVHMKYTCRKIMNLKFLLYCTHAWTRTMYTLGLYIVCPKPEGRYLCVKWYELVPFWLQTDDIIWPRIVKDLTSNQ